MTFFNLSYLVKFFFIYIKISKNLSAKYYQEKNERIQKELAKVIKIVLKMKKKKINDMARNITKISEKMQN